MIQLSKPDIIFEKINDLLKGKFSDQTPISEDHDEMDAIVVGLNMLGDHLQSTTVSIEQFKSSEAELIKTKEALDETVAQLRATLDATADGILVVDTNGNIKSFNDRFIEMWGIPDEIIASRDDGQAIAFVLSQLADPQAFENKIIELYATPERTSFDRLEFKDGRVFERNSRPKIIGDEFTGRVWNFHDVTESENSKRELFIAKTQAEAANQAKSDFLSSMSHELRTPMNAILGFAQMLDLDLNVPLTEKQKTYVSQIMSGGNHLLGLIDQVLELAKIEAGKLTVSLEEIMIDDVCQECLTLVETQATENGLTIEHNLKASHNILADYIRFKQVLLNFLSNAIKYNNVNGTVTLTTKNVSNDMIRVSVSDTGPGIDEEDHAKLFEPFNRLGRETSNIEGTGVGLTITKQLVEAMNGRLGFESKTGMGSTFWVEFPAAAGANSGQSNDTERSQRNEPQEQTFGVATILYIEDNPGNLLLMEAIIERIGSLRLISAHTAELGLAMAEKQLPDLILMDINLPGMDGFAAKKVLGSIDATKDIPVIAISANAMKNHLEAGKVAGFKDYLTKPFNVPKVLEAIEKELNLSTPITPGDKT